MGERRTLWYLCHQNCRNPPWQPIIATALPALPFPGTPVQLAIEFYAGHYVIGEQPFEERPHRDFRFTADKISVCTKNQDVLDFILDLRVLLQLVEKLPETSFRRADILNVLTQVHQMLYYDPTATDAETWHTSLAAARRVMAPPWPKKTVAAPPLRTLWPQPY